MSFYIRVVSFLRGSRHSQRINSGHEVSLSSELTGELEDLRKFSLNSLMMFLGIHLIAGSKTLWLLTLALLIYTISLHLAVSARFLQHCPTLSRVLHAVPFIGISCMAAVELVVGVQSPALASGGLLVGILPLLITAVYHVKWRSEMASTCLPVRLHEVMPPMSDVIETTAALGSEDYTTETFQHQTFETGDN